MTSECKLDEFPVRTFDKIRFRDADRLGHVNNAVFATFLETGRVEVFHDAADPIAERGAVFVIARLAIDFKAEITWPGTVEIGTRVGSLGRSSIKMEQALFQSERCAAQAQSVIVLIDEVTRRPRALPPRMIERLSRLISPREPNGPDATAAVSSGANESKNAADSPE